MMTATVLMAQHSQDYKLHRYDTTDGGILWDINSTGEWGIIRLGSVSAGGNATPKLYNVETEEAFEVKYGGRIISISDVSADGNIVVGDLNGKPVAYNRSTEELTVFRMREKWSNGTLSSITPDGKWAVGHYSGYMGEFEDSELTGDFYFSPLMVNVETGDTLALPGMPTRDMAHLDQHALILNSITPDGRYAIGQMDWYIMQPQSGFTFIYDTQLHSYRVLAFEEHDDTDWTPRFPDLHHIEGSTLSPNGRYLAGAAYFTKSQEGSIFYNEYTVPFRYDMETGEMKIFDNGESNNIEVGAVTDRGILFGNPNTGSPLRNFRILVDDRYWISFSQVCQQCYDFNFLERTGYEYTGTVTGVSGDGSRIVAFPDPTGESYIFDFGHPIDEVCEHVDLLNNYTVTPEEGSTFALISNVEINFGRNIQIVGSGANVHLYKADGTLVMNGLSNGGLTMKTGSKNTAVAAFRTRPLEEGTEYRVVIDAGAISVNGDTERTNQEISITYTGRADGPVQLLKATPNDQSTLRQIDNASAYLLLDFDAPILRTDNCLAYLERAEDGSRLATLTAATGNTEATRHQLLLYPSSTVYLYSGEKYHLIVEAGSISDYSGNANSYNERIELTYNGAYIREAESESVMFADDFNNPNACLTTWLRYEGDHLSPTQTMQAWGFDKDNNPWNYTLRDSEESGDFFAGSHSMYSPAGASDDWMMTPQIAVPSDGKAVLEFDAQSYDPRKSDYLALYIYENNNVLSYLSNATMQQVREQAILLDNILLTAGANAEITAGEWTHYTYSLKDWAGKNIYIAFVNHNESQSAIFVDNVLVQREVNYQIAFGNRDRVVAQDEIIISGQITVMCDETDGGASLTLRDANGMELSRLEWMQIPEKGQAADFVFAQPLPLQIGTEVRFSIDVQIGEKKDTYTGVIQDLAFEPTKRVVLEEMTGSTCVNCPLGIVAIEQCERTYGDLFIPIGIHSYTGDNLGAGFIDYTSYLGILGAPMARINRLPEVYSPMYRQSDEFYYCNVEGETLWHDVVGQELDRLTEAEIGLSAALSEDGKSIDFETQLRYAITASNQQLSLLLVVMEDGIETFQQNGYYSIQSATLADWCNGGPYAEYIVYPYTHDHVVRSVVGQTYSGTIGLFPADLESGVTYTSNLSSPCPATVNDKTKLTAVAMLIDAQTSLVINAAKANIEDYEHNAIENVLTDEDNQSLVLRALSGTVINSDIQPSDFMKLPNGLYLLGDRKILIR